MANTNRKITARNGLTAILLVLVCVNVQAQGNEALWRKTIQKVIPSVVTLRVSKVRSFDTETNALLEGTGFVVDAERGIILTNRHVVSTGPVRAEAVFSNQEEIEVERIYADPVHDFGFLRYDPGDLHAARPSSIPVAPEAAEVGREIRVVGNDAGNRISILDGTIARLDHAAPNYGYGGYNDFNTFYLQAASATSGGSSGSPVIDLEGRAVALNAGAKTQAATSYYLPLDRVKRALDLIRSGEAVPRGGLLTTFEQTSYAELRRLGITEDSETGARGAHPERSGLLVVRATLKGSDASEQLRPGDILLRIEGVPFPDFVQLEEILDAHVGWTVDLAVERQGRVLELSLEVTDLHQVTPSEYITIGEAVLHSISYQQARNFNVALDAIYVAYNGYMLGLADIETASILHEINGRPLNNLDDLEEALAVLRHGDMAEYRFSNPQTPNSSDLRSARVARHWSTAERCRLRAESHEWTCRALAAPSPADPVEPRAAPARQFEDQRLKRIAPALVHVKFDMPFTVSANQQRDLSGAGLIVDVKRGWVMVSRDTVPEAVGDAVLTFNGSLEVRAEVAYVHPVHSMAILRYDPESLGGTPVQEAEFAPGLPAPGEEIYMAAFRPDQDLVIQSYKAGSLDFFGAGPTPLGAFRQANLEVITLENAKANRSGVLVDSKGRAIALWGGFVMETGENTLKLGLAGLPVSHVQSMLDHIKRDAPWRSLEVIWERIPLSVALQRGLPKVWRERVTEHVPQKLQMLTVDRAVAGTPAAEVILPGDILLSINGKLATRPQEIEGAVADGTDAEILVWRYGKEVEFTVETVELGWEGLRELLFWSGALLQNPQRSIAEQLGLKPQGVTIQHYQIASPAHRTLFPLSFFQITRLNETATPNLSAFVAALQQTGGVSARVEGINPKGMPVFASVNLDSEYWPSEILRHGPNGWERTRVSE